MKNLYLLLSIIIIVVLMISAKPINKTKKTVINTEIPPTFNPRLFYQKQCTFCHNKTERLAPDMSKIKVTYLDYFTNKNEFINKITDFVIEPHSSKKIYKGKLGKYEVMPSEMFFDKTKIKAVALYIYSSSEL